MSKAIYERVAETFRRSETKTTFRGRRCIAKVRPISRKKSRDTHTTKLGELPRTVKLGLGLKNYLRRVRI